MTARMSATRRIAEASATEAGVNGRSSKKSGA